MWGNRPNNWLKALLLAHDNNNIAPADPLPIYNVLIDNFSLNFGQARAFRHATQTSNQLQDMITLIQSPFGTGKTSLILALILNCICNQQPWLLTAETHYAVEVCADRISRDLRARNLPDDRIFLIQRASIKRA